MKVAIYNIILHGKGGPFGGETFKGTRVECRARCREIQKKEKCGTEIQFLRYDE